MNQHDFNRRLRRGQRVPLGQLIIYLGWCDVLVKSKDFHAYVMGEAIESAKKKLKKKGVRP